MTNNTGNTSIAATENWQLTALTEALGDLTLTVSDSLSVGRGSDNDVVLGSKQVSRNHALLSVLDGQLYVKDLDSSNGTFINDQRIEGNTSSLLQVSDTIGFASFSFRVNAPVATTQTKASAPAEEAVTHSNEATSSQPIATENVIENNITKESMVDDSVVKNSTVAAPISNTPAIDKMVDNHSMTNEPVVKETGISEILPTTDTIQTSEPQPLNSQAPVAEDTVVKETVIEEPVITEPIVEEPKIEEPVVNEAPVVQPEHESHEHDKTTKTALQEEADPDILRAKQAATAQFSGTANLGQPRDLGTEGNNAMDQAIDNPATTNAVEKKPSGGWFIWVFLAIIIIGLALWLFNMGGA